MAQNQGTSVIVGQIGSHAFETIGRSENWAEQRVVSTTIVGKWDDISGVVKPGDNMADHPQWFNGKSNRNYYVKTVNEVSEDGVTGRLELSLVRCSRGKTKPYNVTWEAGMEEVQMKLINHPMILKNANIDVLLQWESTPPGVRVGKKKGKSGESEIKYYYLPVNPDTWSSDAAVQPVEVKGEWENAYCKAVTQGIDTFNRYLPVITKVSSYLEMPGADYNEDHVVTGGQISDFTGHDMIGKFDVPDLTVAGYQNGKDGVWFKNCDKYTINADGTATRTEGWVFTNDPSHMWIYTNEL